MFLAVVQDVKYKYIYKMDINAFRISANYMKQFEAEFEWANENLVGLPFKIYQLYACIAVPCRIYREEMINIEKDRENWND